MTLGLRIRRPMKAHAGGANVSGITPTSAYRILKTGLAAAAELLGGAEQTELTMRGDFNIGTDIVHGLPILANPPQPSARQSRPRLHPMISTTPSLYSQPFTERSVVVPVDSVPRRNPA